MPPILNPATNDFIFTTDEKASVIKQQLLDMKINPEITVPETVYPEPLEWEDISPEETHQLLHVYNKDTDSVKANPSNPATTIRTLVMSSSLWP